MRRLLIAILAVGAFGFAGSAAAADAVLFGGATAENAHVKMTSVGFQITGVEFRETGVTTFSSIHRLSARFNVTDDACAGGSPRYAVSFGAQTLQIYLGSLNTVTGEFECAANTWLETGNLIGDSTARFDLTQFGGPFYGTYQQAVATLGSRTVTKIEFITDAGWKFADNEQTVLACNFRINEHRFFPCAGRGEARGREKVTICHHTQGQNGTKHVTITIGKPAWNAHQKHGDTLGPCNSTQAQRAHSNPAHAKKFHKPAKRGRGR